MSESENDPDRLADDLEHGADRLDRHSRELGEDIKGVREDWQRKRADGGVPGAVPDEDQSYGDGQEVEDPPQSGSREHE